MSVNHFKDKLALKGLKVTPQRIAILEAVHDLNHPTAEKVIGYIREKYPNIATGTVYKVLEVLVENDLIKKVKTDKDIMRYDGIMKSHHHLYSSDSKRIEDYFDDELNLLLKNYFEKKDINGFTIEDVKVQLIGKFKEKDLF
jgi:Fur family peroxide stress response transcriptional regulator